MGRTGLARTLIRDPKNMSIFVNCMNNMNPFYLLSQQTPEYVWIRNEYVRIALFEIQNLVFKGRLPN